MAPKSFETVLEEERREILAMLEEERSSRKAKGRGSFIEGRRASSPLIGVQPPVRSMLEIGLDLAPAQSSLSGMGTDSPTPPLRAPIRSMLDIDSPLPENMKGQAKLNPVQHRSLSDTAPRPTYLVSREPGVDLSLAYKFSGYQPSNPVAVIPGWSKYASRKLASSSSPRSSMLNLDSSKIVLTDGTVIDKDTAYQRLSDTNIALSRNLESESGNSSRRGSSGENSRPDPSTLVKDNATPEDEDAIAESSDDDDHTSDDEQPRGRKKESRSRDGSKRTPSGKQSSTGPRSALGRAAAADRDGLKNPHKSVYKVKSLLDPEITVTEPAGDKLKSSRFSIHPHTSFDELASGFNTPVTSDAEADFTDIKRAQKLSVNMTSILSTPATGRCVRTIYRGDFAQMQQEAQENQRRVRKYLVATDLSEEAAHALEWTIGTVLRDGDTLLAIYCVDEELGISSNDPATDDAQMQAQTAAIVGTSKSSISMPTLPSVLTSPLSSTFKLVESVSANASPMGRGKNKAEQERFRAIQDITDRVSKLLRRTRLQVKIVIEVIHCKSPKHLITEVIDYLSPTLVILGSRGRSALKGVILGSFSNYLVTKSSVPVMVARKRLRKHSKYKRPAIRLANNLAANPAVRSLATAKVD